ncbi:hypothetical protein Hamer_G027425 [Homarus americanus]|uniref:Uncharacterized protein n=2 Tax=Homarus americanus TaxID=6706 RepID=A0A8J5K8W3_HOMAM|nr:hypothetical protein Hamer_G027425 [Homarus americanus]
MHHKRQSTQKKKEQRSKHQPQQYTKQTKLTRQSHKGLKHPPKVQQRGRTFKTTSKERQEP